MLFSSSGARQAAAGAVVMAFACGVSTLVSAPALAAPVATASPATVTVRVEGSTRTLFEGPVSVAPILDPPGIETPSSGGAHPCDVKDNGANEGLGSALPTPTDALYDATVQAKLPFNAEWFGESHAEKVYDFFVSQVGPDANGGAEEAYWGGAVNFHELASGGCQVGLEPDDEVLWAYNFFNKAHMLKLSGPTVAQVGSPITVSVTDGHTGSAIVGAAIGEMTAGLTTTIPGSVTTESKGHATIVLAQTGLVTLKATQSESVRSNGLTVCVHNGNDGTCGTTAPAAAGSSAGLLPQLATPAPYTGPYAVVADVLGLMEHHHYRHGSAPRLLTGTVTAPTAIKDVQLRLTRTASAADGARDCSYYDGSDDRFHAMPCGAGHGQFFAVGDSAKFSYLLPAPLPRGRYVIDVEASDLAGSTSKLARGSSRVVFYVE
jgi:hypothetical protein